MAFGSQSGVVPTWEKEDHHFRFCYPNRDSKKMETMASPIPATSYRLRVSSKQITPIPASNKIMHTE